MRAASLTPTLPLTLTPTLTLPLPLTPTRTLTRRELRVQMHEGVRLLEDGQALYLLWLCLLWIPYYLLLSCALTACFLLLATCYLLLATGYWPLVTGCPLLTTYCYRRSSSARRNLFVT